MKTLECTLNGQPGLLIGAPEIKTEVSISKGNVLPFYGVPFLRLTRPTLFVAHVFDTFPITHTWVAFSLT